MCSPGRQLEAQAGGCGMQAKLEHVSSVSLLASGIIGTVHTSNMSLVSPDVSTLLCLMLLLGKSPDHHLALLCPPNDPIAINLAQECKHLGVNSNVL